MTCKSLCWTGWAVSTNTKIQIWKQITTKDCCWPHLRWLYQPIQKYKFESKSQPHVVSCDTDNSCINQYKNTNLKANHNFDKCRGIRKDAVSTNTKIQIWKQITTYLSILILIILLYQPIQKYKFESKSQPYPPTPCRTCCCINQYKNTNLKANHNSGAS